MEGSSGTSPLGEPTVPVITNHVPTLSGEKTQSKKAVESVDSVQNQDFNDATSFAEINSPMLLIDDASTPKKKQAFSQEGSVRAHHHVKRKTTILWFTGYRSDVSQDKKIDRQEALVLEAKGCSFSVVYHQQSKT